MINRTNQIVTLENDKEYFIFRQAVYLKETYYIAVEVEDNGTKFKEKVIVLKEMDDNGKKCIIIVRDPNIIASIIKNIKLD